MVENTKQTTEKSHLNQASEDFRYDEIWIRQEIWTSPSGPTSIRNNHTDNDANTNAMTIIM